MGFGKLTGQPDAGKTVTELQLKGCSYFRCGLEFGFNGADHNIGDVTAAVM